MYSPSSSSRRLLWVARQTGTNLRQAIPIYSATLTQIRDSSTLLAEKPRQGNRQRLDSLGHICSTIPPWFFINTQLSVRNSCLGKNRILIHQPPPTAASPCRRRSVWDTVEKLPSSSKLLKMTLAEEFRSRNFSKYISFPSIKTESNIH